MLIPNIEVVALAEEGLRMGQRYPTKKRTERNGGQLGATIAGPDRILRCLEEDG